MSRIFWNRLLDVLKNKYILTVTLFSLWLIFFDSNNLIVRSQMIKDVNQLEEDCDFYRKRIVTDSLKLHELKSSPEMLEKYAREEYLMKKADEEIFIIVEE